MDGVHDMGGMQGFGPVVTPDAELLFHEGWEARQAAVSVLTELSRVTIERMPAREYLDASYFERWLWATERDLLAVGAIQPGEIEEWQRRLANGETPTVRTDPDAVRRAIDVTREVWRFPAAEHPRFVVDGRVRVGRMRPVGHTRCPRYVRGATGTVRAILGEDALPEDASRTEPVYTVAFSSTDLWGISDEREWTVLVDLWESYLEPVEGTDG